MRTVLLNLVETDDLDDNSSYFSTSIDILSTQAKTSPVRSQVALTDRTQFYKSMNEYLIRGEREKAVRKAMENNMWAHALLIASSISKELWRDTVDEFVRSEMSSMSGLRPLQTLYQALGGNGESAVSRFSAKTQHLLSPIANKFESSEPSYLHQWKETLCLTIYNTRGVSQVEALNALSSALAADGRLYAAHSCLLVLNGAVGEAGHPISTISILGEGQNLKSPVSQDLIRHVLLTEIIEFGYTLNTLMQPLLPLTFLVPYKLHHAWLLAEVSLNLEAQAYCEYIANLIGKNQKATSGINPSVIFHLRDLSQRLLDAPNSRSSSGSSWLFGKMATKPKLDGFWSSMEGKFNKFVSGDEDLSHAQSISDMRAAKPNYANGPFNRIASESSLSTMPQDRTVDNQLGRQSYNSYQSLDTQSDLSAPSAFNNQNALYRPMVATHGRSQAVQNNPSYPISPNEGFVMQQQQDTTSPETYSDGNATYQTYEPPSDGTYSYQPLTYEPPPSNGDLTLQGTYNPPTYESPMDIGAIDDPQYDPESENRSQPFTGQSNYSYAPTSQMLDAAAGPTAVNAYQPQSAEESDEEETSSETSSEESSSKPRKRISFNLWLII